MMTEAEIHETIREIKSKFRLFMNGVVSQSMREKGFDYKLNFGIEYPRIKEIAAEYEPNHELAQALWKENIRECKIMAGLLQPVETFFPAFAVRFGGGFPMDGRRTGIFPALRIPLDGPSADERMDIERAGRGGISGPGFYRIGRRFRYAQCGGKGGL